MTILYFTSTGNCLYVSKKIGGNLISIVQAVKNNNYKFEDDKVGIVFPCYGLCVPPYVKEFLKKAQIKSNYIFSVMTYGFYKGAAIKDLIDTAEENSIHFSYVKSLKMVENYLPMFDMKNEVEKIDKSSLDTEIDSICSDIHNNSEKIEKYSIIDRFMTWNHKLKYPYKCGTGFTDKYEISEKCAGCGTCAKVCPEDNIKIVDGKPQFAKSCISCLACIQNCPQNAIKLTSEKSSLRYRNDDIKLEEIIYSNK